MTLLRYALSRLVSLVPTVFVVIALTFALMHAAPGGPFDRERALPAEMQQRLEESYGLDLPVWRQFLNYLGGLVRGDLGPSFRYLQTDVSELVGAAIPVSAGLGFLALLTGGIAGLGAGIYSALRQNRFSDHLVMGIAMTGISIPSFVVAPVLVLLFAIMVDWLPASGLMSPAHFVLPVFALALPLSAYIARLMRASMLEVMKSRFIRTARSQGLSSSTIVFRYALKPALIPVVSFLGPAIAGLLSGSVVIEEIFNIPGLGRLFVQGALNRDYTLVTGIVVFYSTLLICLNLLVDLAYAFLDPRVRFQ